MAYDSKDEALLEAYSKNLKKRDKLQDNLMEVIATIEAQEAKIHGGASLDPFIKPKVTQDNR